METKSSICLKCFTIQPPSQREGEHRNILQLQDYVSLYHKNHPIRMYQELPLGLVDPLSDIIGEYSPSPVTESAQKDLRLLSLFSGGGGMDIGFEGGFICHRRSVPKDSPWIDFALNQDWVKLKPTRFKTVFANDIFLDAKLSWAQYMERNGEEAPHYVLESIVDLVKRHHSGENVFPENIDIVTGGFPCQDFSVAGKRKGFSSTRSHNGKTILEGGDEASVETRGMLYYWMKEVIEITKPKIFIAENVKGLVNLSDVKDIIQKDFSSADGEGYIVLPPQVLHAGMFGVPESRERVIFIGVKRSLLKAAALKALQAEEVPAKYNPYPPYTHSPSNLNPGSLQDWVTCQEVFAALKEPKDTSDPSHRFYSQAKYMGAHCQGQKEITLTGLGPTIRAEHHGNIEFRRLSKEHGGSYLSELEDGLEERRLTPRECALIQTFPPDYPFVSYSSAVRKKFTVSPSAAYKVIGNAVPPILAYNIAQRLQELWPLYFTK